MVLTRQEKEKIVLDLYNQRTPIRDSKTSRNVI